MNQIDAQLEQFGFKKHLDNLDMIEYHNYYHDKKFMLELTYYKATFSWRAMVLELVNPGSDRPFYSEVHRQSGASLLSLYKDAVEWMIEQ